MRLPTTFTSILTHRPKLLVLDEFSSALDAESEAQVGGGAGAGGGGGTHSPYVALTAMGATWLAAHTILC